MFTKLLLMPKFELEFVTPNKPFVLFLFRVFRVFWDFCSRKSSLFFIITPIAFLFDKGIFFFLKTEDIELEHLFEGSFIDCFIFCILLFNNSIRHLFDILNLGRGH